MTKLYKNKVSRRKFLSISATSIALALSPSIMNANTSQEKISWSGEALGAQSNMTLFHKSPSYAKETLNICVKEIKRLENIFSLFIPNSSISKLNKLAYSKYFNKKDKLQKAIIKAKKLISYKNIQINKEEISFKKTNVQITLNGIAQGYITDKITNILKEKGFTNVLVDLGEFNSIGGYDKNRDWNISTPYLKDISYIKLNNQAMASSGGYGTKFNKKYHHLFDAKTGTSANYVNSCTVKAKNAMLADAIATAICVMPKNRSIELMNKYPHIEIYTS